MDWNEYSGWDQQVLLDCGERDQGFLLVRKDGQYVRLSTSAYRLLSAVRKGTSFEDLCRAINEGNRNGVTVDQLQEAYNRLVSQLTPSTSAGKRRQELPLGFWLTCRLIPESWVQRISRPVSRLYGFNSLVILLSLVMTAVVTAIPVISQISTNPTVIIQGYLLFLVSLVAHEFGHACACVRFGAKSRAIGVTLYLIYPAFYSDVSDAWSLPRWQRVIVDVGGCFFQMAFSGLFAILFIFTGWEPLRFALILVVYSCVFSLNPIFKFDGYWVLADALGIVNLGSQPWRIAKHAWLSLFRQSTRPLPWRGSTLAFLVLYTVASMVIWAGFLWRLVPGLKQVLNKAVVHSSTIRDKLITGHSPSGTDWVGLLFSASFLLIFGISLWRLFMVAIPPVFKWVHARIMTARWYSLRRHEELEG
jgi:putative peptide zinc metalloprotease protein